MAHRLSLPPSLCHYRSSATPPATAERGFLQPHRVQVLLRPPRLTSISFELYLIHGFVINLLRPLGLSMWVYSALVFVLSLLLAWLYKQVLALLSRYGL